MEFDSLELFNRRRQYSRAVERLPSRGSNFKTYFGRWELPYRAAARDIAVTKTPKDKLRVLMLGCSSGETVLDLLSIFHKEINKVQKDVRIQIVALDIIDSILDIARNGYYPAYDIASAHFSQQAHDGIEWIRHSDKGEVLVDWDVMALYGHAIEYRTFDIDQGLINLAPNAPFDLVESINSHHRTCNRDISNIREVTNARSLILTQQYKEWQEKDFFMKILEQTEDPEALRFMSGLIKPRRISIHERQKYGKICPFLSSPLSDKTILQACKAFEKLGNEAKEVVNGSNEDKMIFLERHPLLKIIAHILASHGGFTYDQRHGAQLFYSHSEPDVQIALDRMLQFAQGNNSYISLRSLFTGNKE